jgi:hypothetical protein
MNPFAQLGEYFADGTVKFTNVSGPDRADAARRDGNSGACVYIAHSVDVQLRAPEGTTAAVSGLLWQWRY